MTLAPMQQQQPLLQPELALPVLIPEGYALARLMAQDRQKAIKAIQRASDRWINQLMLQLETMEKAYGVRRNPDRIRRLAGYLQKPEPIWQEQAAKFPADYEADWQDFQELRAAAERGDFRDKMKGG